ncbi:MAG: allantoinase AllB [Gemmatimonadota bacterium]|nr:allantoinase AllB [Gemmatimonadota bacterium]
MSDLVIRGQRVVTPEGVRPASVHISTGRIVRVGAIGDATENRPVVEAGDLLVMPGLVDSHVHVNEPGRVEWEGFETATRAAAAGGITTICDMPLNSIPATTTVAALEAKRAAAHGKCHVNVEYIGGVVPGNAGELKRLRAAGVVAFKCFLTPSGVEEFGDVGERDLRSALPELAGMNAPLMVHAEDPAEILEPAGPSREYTAYLATRPIAAERSAIALMTNLVEWCATPVHIVHLSSASSLDLIRNARAKKLPITVETCPHYLTFAAEEIPDGATQYKCAPPIRSSAERDALWEALIAGQIDLVASDHSPCPPEMKDTGGDFFAAWGGIASLQISMPAVWTGARERGVAPEKIAEWMSAGPARLVGLDGWKGKLAGGYDADIVIWNPDASFVVDPGKLEHRNKITPYAGMKLFGVVEKTFLAGRQVFARDTQE